MQIQQQEGTVTYVNPLGVAYVSTEAGEEFGFSFKTIANYHGEEASEMGLRKGSVVRFQEQDGKVLAVELSRPIA